jgi:hypothetical protein
VEFLSTSVYLFDLWARDRINRIALHMQTKCFTPAQKCLLQGQEPEGLLFLFRGSLKVYRSPVTYMSKAEANIRQRMAYGGASRALGSLSFCIFTCIFKGPFLTAVPDGAGAPSDGVTLPALQKLRTQVHCKHDCYVHQCTTRFKSHSKPHFRPKKPYGQLPSCEREKANQGHCCTYAPSCLLHFHIFLVSQTRSPCSTSQASKV